MVKKFTEQPDKIAVLGLGREGTDLLRFLHKFKDGLKPVGLNVKAITESDPNYKDIKRLTSALRFGDSYLDNLTDFDLIFRSPGVPLDLPALKKAMRKGVRISSLTKLFFELCPAKIVGITGTKGKSTVTSLTTHLLKARTGGKVYFGGNIGYPPLSLLAKLTKQDIVVLELSSFQLEDLTKSPHIAVMLGISPEHLDRHKTFKKYLTAKLNLVRYQNKTDFVVIGIDEKVYSAVVKIAKSKIVRYSQRKILQRGVYLAGDDIIYRDARSGHRQIIMEVREIPLSGRHNISNALAAVTVALLAGVTPEKIRKQIKSFQSLEHRLELVGAQGEVRFINDSIATTPVATIAAINATVGPVVLILGGSTKKEDFRSLINLLASRQDIKGAVLIGDTADKLASLLKSAKVKFPFIKPKDFPSAMTQAHQYAEGIGTVLLSPACASFGWFKDAYDRGTQFKQLALQIINKK